MKIHSNDEHNKNQEIHTLLYNNGNYVYHLNKSVQKKCERGIHNFGGEVKEGTYFTPSLVATLRHGE